MVCKCLAASSARAFRSDSRRIFNTRISLCRRAIASIFLASSSSAWARSSYPRRRPLWRLRSVDRGPSLVSFPVGSESFGLFRSLLERSQRGRTSEIWEVGTRPRWKRPRLPPVEVAGGRLDCRGRRRSAARGFVAHSTVPCIVQSSASDLIGTLPFAKCTISLRPSALELAAQIVAKRKDNEQ
jgi:hypothetical protein